MTRRFVVAALCCVAVLGTALATPLPTLKKDSDQRLSIEELVTTKGFTIDSFVVQTQDGYRCTMHHIGHPGVMPTKGPVLLQHGLLDSSATWVLNSANSSLAFMLASQGFDVYMGNSRGNKFCESHAELTTKDSAFWEFSWEDMARFDVAAFVSAVLERTNSDSLAYFGHSQGCAMMFAALVLQPELAPKVNSFVAMAPVTFLGNTASPLVQAAATTHLDELAEWLGLGEFLPDSAFLTTIVPAWCTGRLTGWSCDSVLSLLTGFNPDKLDDGREGVYLSHFPAGTSVKNMVHWAQSLRNFNGHDGDFSRFDYGEWDNLQRYGRRIAPAFDLSSFPTTQVDLIVFCGGLDKLATPTDTKRLHAQLPQDAHSWTDLPDYDHIDFVWGNDAWKHVYQPAIDRLPVNTPSQEAKDQSSTSKRGGFGAVPVAVVWGVAGAVVVVAGAVLAGRSRGRRRLPAAPVDVYLRQ